MEKKARILIVEDEAIVAEDLEMAISDIGYEVVGRAASAKDAVKKALALKPDLVLMDIVLRGNRNGIDASQEIKEKEDIPIIFLTAYSDVGLIDRAKSTEPYAYLVKPFQEKQLLASIEMALYKSRLEKKLKESEGWLSTTLNSIGDAVIATDATGYVKFINPVADSLTGWKHEEAVGKPLEDVFTIVDVETGEHIENPVSVVIREGRIVGLANHTVLVAKDGRAIPIDDSGAPIRDEKGTIIGVVLVFRDITERKRAEEALHELTEELERRVEERTEELKKAHAELVRKEKLATLGQLAGGIAHDLRQPLGVINNAIYFLKITLPEADETTKEYLDLINDEIKNSEEIISGLLELTRTRPPERREVNVSSLIEKALEKFDIPDTIKLTNDIPGDIPAIFVDAAQIDRVFYNIINNAVQAMSADNERELAIHATLNAARKVEVSFRDTGVGIPEANMKKLFEPLFTTKVRGIGLGLSICKNLIEINSGEITVQSKEGEGTTVTVALPLYVESTEGRVK